MSSKYLLAFLLSLISIAAYTQSIKWDQQISQLIRDANIPGLSIAYFEDGRITYSNTFGVKSKDQNIPVDEETVFEAASLSKPIFAYIVLQLVEEKKFDLDKPLYEYMPYEDLQHDDQYKKITGRMVLSHSSGLPNWRSGKLNFEYAPGKRFRYSGEGFVFLQKVMETITNKDLQQLAEERVFTPLKMDRTSYIWKEAFDENCAFSHNEMGRTQSKNKPSQPNAAYSLHTTATDYAKFLLGMIDQSGLKKKTIDQMLTQEVVAIPFSNEVPKNPKVFWGLGVGLQNASDGQQFWHWGDNGPFKAYFTVNKKLGKGMVYFANSTHGLSITADLVKLTLDSDQPSTQWNNYPNYKAPTQQLLFNTLEKGFDLASRPYWLDGKGHHDPGKITEGEMNQLGYQLLNLNRFEDAKKAFWSNIKAFPSSSNVYDSYAEACLKAGDLDQAAQYYAQAAEMDPDNTRAATISKNLTNPGRGNQKFQLSGYPNARIVSVAGTFNDWDPLVNVLRWKNGAWTGQLQLDPGTYPYKFVVDGVWILDPNNPESTHKDGHHNSILKVE